MPSTSWSTPGGQHEIILFVMVRASKKQCPFRLENPANDLRLPRFSTSEEGHVAGVRAGTILGRF
jgi:hypothetical protein